jgi:hypothetical protein
MVVLSRTLCLVFLAALAFVIFIKPRQIVTETPPEPQVSNLQPSARPRPQPQPKPKPVTGATFEPENEQPAFRPLQPKPAQASVATEPVFRPLQPMAKNQSAFAPYDRASGTVEGASGKPVEVWGGSDDGLTIRLKDALKDALRSPEFHLSSGNKPGTLVITLPSNVGWKQVGGRTQVLYTAEFASDGKNLGGSQGSCWDDALAKCAAQIVRDLKTARNGVQ